MVRAIHGVLGVMLAGWPALALGTNSIPSICDTVRCRAPITCAKGWLKKVLQEADPNKGVCCEEAECQCWDEKPNCPIVDCAPGYQLNVTEIDKVCCPLQECVPMAYILECSGNMCVDEPEPSSQVHCPDGMQVDLDEYRKHLLMEIGWIPEELGKCCPPPGSIKCVPAFKRGGEHLHHTHNNLISGFLATMAVAVVVAGLWRHKRAKQSATTKVSSPNQRKSVDNKVDRDESPQMTSSVEPL